jgi:hypothetical protein
MRCEPVRPAGGSRFGSQPTSGQPRRRSQDHLLSRRDPPHAHLPLRPAAKTDKNGAYQLWMDHHSNPLTLVAAKDGWQPQTTTAKIPKGATTTVSFTLKSATC